MMKGGLRLDHLEMLHQIIQYTRNSLQKQASNSRYTNRKEVKEKTKQMNEVLNIVTLKDVPQATLFQRQFDLLQNPEWEFGERNERNAGNGGGNAVNKSGNAGNLVGNAENQGGNAVN